MLCGGQFSVADDLIWKAIFIRTSISGEDIIFRLCRLERQIFLGISFVVKVTKDATETGKAAEEEQQCIEEDARIGKQQQQQPILWMVVPSQVFDLHLNVHVRLKYCRVRREERGTCGPRRRERCMDRGVRGEEKN
ncbi:hypothetical protein YC2023_012080 [Brassica napus]